MTASRLGKSTGIVLRIAPFSRTSQTVTWLTPDRGRLITVVKGAQRCKAGFLGQLDLFYRCEIVFYSREGRDVCILKECCPLDTRTALRSDWKSMAFASYACDFVTRTAPSGTEAGDLFKLLDSSLAFAASHGTSKRFFLWFELTMLKELGISPQLGKCVACSGEIADIVADHMLSIARGGLVCRACAARPKHQVDPRIDGPIRIRAAVLRTMRGMQNAAGPETLSGARIPELDLLETGSLLSLFLGYHLHAELRSRGVAIELMA